MKSGGPNRYDWSVPWPMVSLGGMVLGCWEAALSGVTLISRSGLSGLLSPRNRMGYAAAMSRIQPITGNTGVRPVAERAGDTLLDPLSAAI
jgi:hypothetical protein